MSIEIFVNDTTGNVDVSVNVVFLLEKDYHFCVGHIMCRTHKFSYMELLISVLRTFFFRKFEDDFI